MRAQIWLINSIGIFLFLIHDSCQASIFRKTAYPRCPELYSTCSPQLCTRLEARLSKRRASTPFHLLRIWQLDAMRCVHAICANTFWMRTCKQTGQLISYWNEQGLRLFYNAVVKHGGAGWKKVCSHCRCKDVPHAIPNVRMPVRSIPWSNWARRWHCMQRSLFRFIAFVKEFKFGLAQTWAHGVQCLNSRANSETCPHSEFVNLTVKLWNNRWLSSENAATSVGHPSCIDLYPPAEDEM